MIASLVPYAAYKDADVPWLGQVPIGWDVLPALAAYKERHVKNTGMQERGVLSLSYGKIIQKPEEKLRGLVPESFETYQIVEPGNIIVRTTDLQNDQTSLRVGISPHRGIITSAYMCLETRPCLSPEFGYQFLNTYDLLKIIYSYGSGLRQNLDFSHIRRMPVLVPPAEEQAAIVRFLDHVERKLRRYIAAKRKLIKLLEEEKQAIIHRAVTRGLDPNVRLKSSGIDWLGDIPEHWSVSRNFSLFGERREVGRTDLPILAVSLRTGVTPVSETDDDGRERKLIEDRAKYQIAHCGDIAYNMMRMWQGAVGVVPCDGLVSPAYVVAKPRTNVCSAYYEFLFRTGDYKNEVNRVSRGIVSDRNRLYWDSFKAMPSPAPPVAEQGLIVRYILDATQRLSATIDTALREIELLNEYRTRLISDVVTGKLDVRTAAASLPADVEDAPLDDELENEAAVDEDEAYALEEDAA